MPISVHKPVVETRLSVAEWKDAMKIVQSVHREVDAGLRKPECRSCSDMGTFFNAETMIMKSCHCAKGVKMAAEVLWGKA